MARTSIPLVDLVSRHPRDALLTIEQIEDLGGKVPAADVRRAREAGTLPATAEQVLIQDLAVVAHRRAIIASRLRRPPGGEFFRVRQILKDRARAGAFGPPAHAEPEEMPPGWTTCPVCGGDGDGCRPMVAGVECWSRAPGDDWARHPRHPWSPMYALADDLLAASEPPPEPRDVAAAALADPATTIALRTPAGEELEIPFQVVFAAARGGRRR